MDIDLLSKMVKELILDNERVVLPGLGSFVAEKCYLCNVRAQKPKNAKIAFLFR